MNRADLVTDELIQAMFERRARRAAPDGVREDILARIATSPQRKLRWARLTGFLSIPVLRPAWVVLLIVVALLAAAIGVAVVGKHLRTPLPGGSWAYTEYMLQPRSAFTATLLADGNVLVAGGNTSLQFSAETVTTDSSELYDPTTGTWTPTGAMTQARAGFTATRLADGTVLAVGGNLMFPPALDSAELYDPSTGSWTNVGNLPDARSGFTATLLRDGRVLVTGGETATGLITTAELYDPATRSWTATGPMVEPRRGFTATLMRDGKVLVAGGTRGDVALADTELFDPGNGTWAPAAPMLQARKNAAAALLPDGTVLVAGGNQASGLFFDALGSAEVYDPSSGSWAATGTMTHPDASIAATLLLDGRVLVLGGFENVAGIHVVELYDPGDRSWRAVGKGIASSAPTTTLLLNGNVLVAGGDGTAPMNAAELYDPTGGQ